MRRARRDEGCRLVSVKILYIIVAMLWIDNRIVGDHRRSLDIFFWLEIPLVRVVQWREKPESERWRQIVIS